MSLIPTPIDEAYSRGYKDGYESRAAELNRLTRERDEVKAECLTLRNAIWTDQQEIEQRVWDAAIEAAMASQIPTAERPTEDAYQHGKFDGVMQQLAAIRQLKRPT